MNSKNGSDDEKTGHSGTTGQSKTDEPRTGSRGRRRRTSRSRNAAKAPADAGATGNAEPVVEQQLGPGHRKRIFNKRRPAGDSSDASSSSTEVSDGSQRESASTTRTRSRRSRKRRTSVNPGPGAPTGPRTRSGPQGGKESQKRTFVPMSTDRGEGNDGTFGDDAGSTYASARKSPGRQNDRSEISETEEWFSAPLNVDYATMDPKQLRFLVPHVVNDADYYESLPVLHLDERPPMGRLMDVVGVKMLRSGNIEWYDCENHIYERGEQVIVETDRGIAIGEVKVPTERRYISREKIFRVLRRATGNDTRQRDRHFHREQEAFILCRKQISEMRLPMKLVEVVFLHGGNKAVFYFMAEGRVDFRNLVRDLARDLHLRIEMRQIGVRDAARMIGGLGPCGHSLCCCSFLQDFHPVSIRMAKVQDLVLNPEKVSGQCGRLMCCLAYEEEVYREKARGMPKMGKIVKTPDGPGRVRDRDILRSLVKVNLESEPGLKTFSVADISPMENPAAKRKPRDVENSTTNDDASGEAVPSAPRPASE